jgi:hypothetical protein
VGLDGSSVFTVAGMLAQLRPGMQPVVAPDGSVHTVLSAYAPSGSPLWVFPTPYPYNVFTPADIDSAGSHYFVQNLSQLFALDPDGSQRWHVTLTDYLEGPIVDPQNTQLIMGSADTLDHAGFIVSKSAKDGSELWRVTLPIEDPTVFNSITGQYGYNQYVDTRAQFTGDGLTAYLVTATATGDNNTSKAFVYSLNAGGIPPPSTSASLRSTSITLSAKLQRNGAVTVTGVVAVRDGKGTAVPGAAVAATWTRPQGALQKQIATTTLKGDANFSTTSGRGTYTLKVSDISKTGYTFDAANGVLTKSITK